MICDAPEKYCTISGDWEALRRDEAVTPEAIETFVQKAKFLKFQLSSDFQQDKLLPSWNLSPQPGPT